MQNLLIPLAEGEFTTPNIHFDLSTYVFEIKGESFLENTDDFYTPVTDWLQEFTDTYSDAIIFNFKFAYYNSSSSKSILKIMKILKKYSKKVAIEVNWFYPTNNDDLLQEGIDYQDMVEMPIKMREF